MLISMLAMLAAAPSLDPKVRAKVDEVTPAIVELRHRIHQYPELGNRETRTAQLVFFYFLGTTKPVLLDYLQRESGR